LTELLRLTGITKRFPGVDALRNVSFDIDRNTVHCIVGENGAGKSTLINVLTGLVRPDAGRLELAGERVDLAHRVTA
jgi:ABC-type sugar transport system ATPase subunit